jgi:hypothetical protein
VSFGTVTIGRLALREALTQAGEKTNESGVTQVSISGQEACPPHTPTTIASMRDDIRGVAGMMLPVTWTDKADLDGYYMVGDVTAELMNFQQEVITLDWSMTLERVGSDSETDIEARLSGPLTRTNSYSATGERWHSPPIGHTAYWSGATAPSVLTRTGADGAQIVYRDVPVAVNPRYACAVTDYPGGRCRYTDDTGRERSGSDLAVPVSEWQVDNALVRLRWDSSGIRLANHDGTTWDPRTFQVTVGGVLLGTPTRVTLLRNDYEAVSLRLLFDRSPVGRATVDATIRRGSRVLECYVQTLPAATIVVRLGAAVASTATSGYLTATSNDSAGNRFFIGTAGSATASTVACSLTKTSASAMDFVVGQVVGGGSAVSGDTATALYAQALGAPSEFTRAIRR